MSNSTYYEHSKSKRINAYNPSTDAHPGFFTIKDKYCIVFRFY